MMGQVCEDLNVEFLRIGSITVAFSKEEAATLLSLLERAKENNVEAELLTQEQLRKIEPNISPLATSGLLCKSAGVVNPFTLNIKFMENAMDNGVELHLNEEVTNITKRVDFYEVFTNLGNVYRTKTIVNAAGLYSDKVLSFVEKPEFEIEPRKGEYFVLDHFNTSFVKHTLFMCPTKVGKGILVSPTTSFNYILGPSNDLTYKEDYMTNTEILNSVKEGAFKLIPSIPLQENIRQFSGIRANSSTHDFVIGGSKINKGFFNCAAQYSPCFVFEQIKTSFALKNTFAPCPLYPCLVFEFGIKSSVTLVEFATSKKLAIFFCDNPLPLSIISMINELSPPNFCFS